jgi:hypothetical protein
MPGFSATYLIDGAPSRVLITSVNPNLARPCCPLRHASLWVASGRPLSAKISKPRSGTLSVPTQQEKWSRGCRRAHKSFWLWPWPPSWQLAHLKSPSRWHRKSLSSRPTPASTSNITARAWRLSSAGPAPAFCLPPCGLRLPIISTSAGSRRLHGAVSVRLARGPARSPARC